MYLNIFMDVIDKLNEWIEPFRNFMMENHNNPIVWMAIFLIGLAVFAFTYNALHRD